MIINSLISQWKKLTSGLFCVFILQLSQPEAAHRGAGSQGPGGKGNYRPERDGRVFRSQKTGVWKDQNQCKGKGTSVCYLCANIRRHQQQNRIRFCGISNTRVCVAH